jgi:hypothetical protein
VLARDRGVSSRKMGRPGVLEDAQAQADGRDTLRRVLERAALEPEFLTRLADDPANALSEYGALTWQERAAVASGDVRRIEGWLGKLDQRLSTWLTCRLQQTH